MSEQSKDLRNITRIDILTHPFYGYTGGAVNSKGARYTRKEAEYVFELWKQHIDKVAADPSRFLMIAPNLYGTDQQVELTDKLIQYAESKLGDRFAKFFIIYKRGPRRMDLMAAVQTGRALGDQTFDIKGFFESRGFNVDPKTIKTRGLGECTTLCVVDYLHCLNRSLGMHDPIPFRNPQSTILPRKSVTMMPLFRNGQMDRPYPHYPHPWDLEEFKKEAKNMSKEELRARMDAYMQRRIAAAESIHEYSAPADNYKEIRYKSRVARRIV